MHIKRWITAVVLLPPLVLLILKGGSLLFTLLVILVSVITMGEYYRIVFRNHKPRVATFNSVWGFLNGTLLIIAVGATTTAHGTPAVVVLAPLALNLLGAAIVSLFRFPTSQDAPVVVVKQGFGVVYIALFLSCAVLIYNDPAGPLWILFLMGIVAMGDTGAYYVGSNWGHHKLCPAVSPKKSIEGAVGGLAANVVFALGFKFLFFSQLSFAICILMALVIGAIGQVGDLFESEFKRIAGVKDSGTLLPGHGGFLDRIDALLFALPTAYLLKELLIK